ncbi:MAG: NUDIX hydrolase [Solobacterium sp.]|nr:NUDIX hydrolase [Solobacterium sp.]
MNMKEETLKKEIVYDGKIITVRSDTARTPEGDIVPREVVEHPGGVGIAMEDEEGKFFMVTQYRYAQECVTIEFPAGKKEYGEDPLTTAKREIVEETGYEGTDFVYLGKMFPTPAYDSEVVDFYYTKKGAYRGQHLDADEYLNLSRMSLDEIIDAAVEGKIPDAKTMCMALLIQQMKARQK